jgi:hypothetical protein
LEAKVSSVVTEPYNNLFQQLLKSLPELIRTTEIALEEVSVVGKQKFLQNFSCKHFETRSGLGEATVDGRITSKAILWKHDLKAWTNLGVAEVVTSYTENTSYIHR